jgi:hypothetical protein
MMSRRSLLPLTAGAALLAAPALAQTYCAERTAIAERLTAGYAEQLVGGGMQSADGLIEVWTTATGATWTILMTRPDGISCVVATGTDWYSRKPEIETAGVAG